jgi:hypothetical protein
MLEIRISRNLIMSGWVMLQLNATTPPINAVENISASNATPPFDIT